MDLSYSSYKRPVRFESRFILVQLDFATNTVHRESLTVANSPVLLSVSQTRVTSVHHDTGAETGRKKVSFITSQEEYLASD